MDVSPAQSTLLERLVSAIEIVPGVRIWLFGSLAAGECDEFSDLDVRPAADMAAREIMEFPEV